MDAFHFAFARKITDYRIALPNSAGAIAGDEASRNVNEGRAFHPARKGDNVLRADHVGAQAALESGIESNVAGGVDDDVDIAGDGLSFFFRVPEVSFGNVTTSHDYFIVNKTLERAAIAFA